MIWKTKPGFLLSPFFGVAVRFKKLHPSRFTAFHVKMKLPRGLLLVFYFSNSWSPQNSKGEILRCRFFMSAQRIVFSMRRERATFSMFERQKIPDSKPFITIGSILSVAPVLRTGQSLFGMEKIWMVSTSFFDPTMVLPRSKTDLFAARELRKISPGKTSPGPKRDHTLPREQTKYNLHNLHKSLTIP